jgi:hypothetical protein
MDARDMTMTEESKPELVIVSELVDSDLRFVCVGCKNGWFVDQQHWPLGNYYGLCESCFRALPPEPLRSTVAEAFEVAAAEALDKAQDTDWAGLPSEPPEELPND